MAKTTWNGVAQFKGKRVGVCVSGGLDSKTVCKRLVMEGIDVLAFSADLGQPDEDDIQNVKKRMATCGVDTIIVDLKDDMAEGCFDIIQAQARYDGGYWNTTGIGRYVTCRGLIGAMQQHNVDVLSHGATGRGNDQMRFERYTNVLAPKMSVFAPWRDAELLVEFPGRTEMAAYLNKFKIEAFVGPKKKYSTDANLAGLSHEAEDLESIETPMLIVDPEMGVWPKDAPDKVEEVVLRFEAGRCVAINGKAVTPQEAIREANAIGGRNGVGISHALENRIIGTKSRGVYEAPGMELLGTGLKFIYQAVLDRRATKLFEHLSSLVSDQLYDGRFFDPATTASLLAIRELTKTATGTVTVGAYKGNLFFLKLTGVEASLYNEADSSMEASDGLNPVSSQGYAEVQSVEARSLALAGQITSNPGAGSTTTTADSGSSKRKRK
uniref:argininosuccinate synthase n=1 Tax=Haptolina brevifila TaxID=156173 RepID=A0A7S2FXV2_9EUKA|eukprot:CAMPEP_0174717206 /NCGR_PEP_ID=MMETSP1094-20130205/26181_1 /TAXON_ID=156173 /ORGANISM="Chrysochromulina brevifilum, Strain UTEX LB 985" /LENGTH=437 /DNA_ID=CAMNT_0015917111 /DNA_START=50 /DNA_END=1363 /DNA_ORIENTATION=-